MIDRKCIDGDKAGCATCAKGEDFNDPSTAYSDYCQECGRVSICNVTNFKHEIDGRTENCNACRWIMPVGKRQEKS